jgi:hypothetical protein
LLVVHLEPFYRKQIFKTASGRRRCRIRSPARDLGLRRFSTMTTQRGMHDREFRLSPLSEALDKAGDYGITIVSMKQDWRGRVLI